MTSAEPPAAPQGYEDVPALPAAVGRATALEETPPRRSGCALPAAMGCGCLLLLSGVGFLLMVINARGLIEWQMKPLRRAVESGLPPEIGDAERQRFRTAFDALPDALTRGDLDPGTVWRFQRQLAEAAAAGQAGTLDRAAAMALLESLEGVVAGNEPAAPSAPRRRPQPEGVEARWNPWSSPSGSLSPS